MAVPTVDVEELKYRLGQIRAAGMNPRDAILGAHLDGEITTAMRRELLAWLADQ